MSANRGSYQRICVTDRERLIRAFEENQDWVLLAEQMNINRQTARSIITTWQTSGRSEALARGGNRPRALTEAQVQEIVAWIEEHPALTLQEIKQRLMAEYPDWRPCTIQTISRAIDGSLITLKKLHTIPSQWVTAQTKESRQQYAQWLMAEGMQKNLIFCDEMGCNVWTARTQGRAAVGARAVRIVSGQRGRNLTVCLAVSPQWGLLHARFLRGGMTQDIFNEFVVEVATLVTEEFVLLCDNAPCHRKAPAMNEGQALRFLPPYSPFLNMTERAISCIKAALKRSLSNTEEQTRLGDRHAASQRGITLQEHRLQILEQHLETTFEEITQAKCQGWHHQSLQYVPRCLQLEDILF